MIAKTIVIGWTLIIFVSFIVGLTEASKIASSDAALGFAIWVALIGHFGMWCAVAVPTFVISRIFSTDMTVRLQHDRSWPRAPDA